jgi:hypothetical protein
MEYEITPKPSGKISYGNNILNGLNSTGRSYQSNTAAKIMSYIQTNFNIRQLSTKGDASVQYYLYSDIFSVNNRKILTYYPFSNTIYFGYAVPNAGEMFLTFDGATLFVNQLSLTGSLISKMQIPALSGIKLTDGKYYSDPMPNGNYMVKNGHHRTEKGYYRDGVGYSFDVIPLFSSLNGKKMERTDLRIHPDGNKPGTLGCIGLDTNKAVLTAFYDDMSSYIAKKGSIALKVNDPNNPNIMYDRLLNSKQKRHE